MPYLQLLTHSPCYQPSSRYIEVIAINTSTSSPNTTYAAAAAADDGDGGEDSDDDVDADVDAFADDDVEDQLKENHYKYIICTLNVHKTIGLENV